MIAYTAKKIEVRHTIRAQCERHAAKHRVVLNIRSAQKLPREPCAKRICSKAGPSARNLRGPQVAAFILLWISAGSMNRARAGHGADYLGTKRHEKREKK